ncbi:MAG: pantoate--beta-alanine ligase [Mycobacteriales bacterium]
MKVVHTRAELAAARAAESGRAVALVPTMGALHRGHRHLFDRAHENPSAALYVSIFVNPLQFGPAEDLAHYPRPIADDLDMCAAAAADVVFAPSVEELYRGGTPAVTVHAGPLGDILEGRSRPGHYDGVLTVVAKLFNLVRPDTAYFGQKDAQQLVLIRRMVRDLDYPLEIAGVATVRDEDGLALSSRNRYLSPAERGHALALSRALRAGQAAAPHGAAAVLDDARAVLAGTPQLQLDYLELIDADTFDPLDPQTGRGLLLVAARVGGTRLIDNVTLELGALPERADGMYSKET